MWNQEKQARLDRLRDSDFIGTLSPGERVELDALIQERCRHEAGSVVEAVRRTNEGNASLADRIGQIQAQNRELEALIQEQETYLSEAQAMVTQMETRRSEWRERYQRVTGRRLGDPVGAGTAS